MFIKDEKPLRKDFIGKIYKPRVIGVVAKGVFGTYLERISW